MLGASCRVRPLQAGGCAGARSRGCGSGQRPRVAQRIQPRFVVEEVAACVGSNCGRGRVRCSVDLRLYPPSRPERWPRSRLRSKRPTQNEPVAANLRAAKNYAASSACCRQSSRRNRKAKAARRACKFVFATGHGNGSRASSAQAPEQVEIVPQEVAPASGAGGNGIFHRSFAPAAAPAVSAAQPAVRAFREEQKKQDERILQKEEQQQARTGENRALPPPSPETHNPAPPTAPTTDGSTPGDQNAEASSSNRPIGDACRFAREASVR